MADRVQQTSELQVKLTLRNGTAQTTRTLTVADPVDQTEQFYNDMSSLRTKLTTGALSGVVQPANWRDDDETFTPYETADVEFTRVDTTKTFYDLDGGADVDPSILRIEPTTVAASEFGGAEDQYDPGRVEIKVYEPANMTNPTLSATGRKPTNASAEIESFDGYWLFSVEKQVAAVSTGSNELEIHFTATDTQSNVATGDVTITGVDGEGYAISL